MNDKSLEKIISKFKNTNKNVSFKDIDKVLNSIGYECNKKNSGSHHIYKKRGCNPISIPRHNPIKPRYVDFVIEAYDETIQKKETK